MVSVLQLVWIGLLLIGIGIIVGINVKKNSISNPQLVINITAAIFWSLLNGVAAAIAYLESNYSIRFLFFSIGLMIGLVAIIFIWHQGKKTKTVHH